MDALGPWHLLIVAAIFVLLFGAKRLPDASKSMARSLKIFKSEMHSSHDDAGHEEAAADAAASQLPAALPTAPVAPGPGEPVGAGHQTSGR
jgi:sec-independent protein translocase protein TatA